MSISGKYMTCTINGTEVEGNYSWRAAENADPLDRTVAADLGFERQDLGVFSIRVTIRGYMDVSTGNYAVVQRGVTITNLQLYRVRGEGTAAFTIPEALVLRSNQGGEVRGKIEWDCEVAAQGSYTSSDPA